MELDRTTIRVRERGANESLDLALHVIRRWWRPLLASFFMAAVPMAILNAWLVEWIFSQTDLELLGGFELFGTVFRYAVNMALLVALEAPLAAALTTRVLGNLVFEATPDWKNVRRNLTLPLVRLWTSHLVFRGVGLGWLLLALARYNEATGYSGYEFLLLVLTGIVLLVRLFRPYLPEVLLLERLQWRKSSERATNVAQRMSAIHGSFSGDVVVRSILLSFICFLLSFALLGLLLFVGESLFFAGLLDPVNVRWAWPLALWTTAFFATVARFLNYLDLRIRGEGWEIELQLRAEATRMSTEIS